MTWIDEFSKAIERANGGQTLVESRDFIPDRDISLAPGSYMPTNCNGYRIACRHALDGRGRVLDDKEST